MSLRTNPIADMFLRGRNGISDAETAKSESGLDALFAAMLLPAPSHLNIPAKAEAFETGIGTGAGARNFFDGAVAAARTSQIMASRDAVPSQAGLSPEVFVERSSDDPATQAGTVLSRGTFAPNSNGSPIAPPATLPDFGLPQTGAGNPNLMSIRAPHPESASLFVFENSFVQPDHSAPNIRLLPETGDSDRSKGTVSTSLKVPVYSASQPAKVNTPHDGAVAKNAHSQLDRPWGFTDVTPQRLSSGSNPGATSHGAARLQIAPADANESIVSLSSSAARIPQAAPPTTVFRAPDASTGPSIVISSESGRPRESGAPEALGNGAGALQSAEVKADSSAIAADVLETATHILRGASAPPSSGLGDSSSTMPEFAGRPHPAADQPDPASIPNAVAGGQAQSSESKTNSTAAFQDGSQPRIHSSRQFVPPPSAASHANETVSIPPAASAQPSTAIPQQLNPALLLPLQSQKVVLQPPGVVPNVEAHDVEALAAHLAARIAGGERHFDIRLDPPDFGHVDVRLTVDTSGRAQAHVVVDRPQTLELLQRDAATLQSALKETGLNFGDNSLNFSLQGQERGDGRPESSPRSPSQASSENNDALISPSAASLGSASRLDIRI